MITDLIWSSLMAIADMVTVTTATVGLHHGPAKIHRAYSHQ
jgi:hypothetical protein